MCISKVPSDVVVISTKWSNKVIDIVYYYYYYFSDMSPDLRSWRYLYIPQLV